MKLRLAVQPKVPLAKSPGLLSVGDYCADFRVGLDAGNHPLDGFKERDAQSLTLVFVPSDSLAEFLAGGSADTDVHRLRISRSILSRTSAQPSSFTVPASIAVTLRSISAAHAASAFGSVGPSRLPSSSAAN